MNGKEKKKQFSYKILYKKIFCKKMAKNRAIFCDIERNLDFFYKFLLCRFILKKIRYLNFFLFFLKTNIFFIFRLKSNIYGNIAME